MATVHVGKDDNATSQAAMDGEDFTPVEQRDEAIEFAERKDLKRGLHQRHIQMIGLCGAIGTGLFLGSGKAVAQAGPLGAFLGYTFVGLLVVGPVFSIAEMSALVPLSGGIIRHAEIFCDPALAFADGWNLVYAVMVSAPAEIVAAAVLVQFWITINPAIWITVFGLLLILSNMILVRIYGELEFILGILKIMLIIGINIMALVIACGGGPNGHAYGFQYWRNPGPFVQYLDIQGSLGRFLGFWTVFANAVYSFSGVQNISLAAAETESPRQNIPRAAKRIFWRVGIFYSLTLFMVGLIVPSDDPKLLRSTGTASQSPFVIAATRAGINVLPSVINAIVLTSAWSAGNAAMLQGSRILFGLAREGRAPAIFTRTNRNGIPWIAVAYFSLFLALGYMTVSDSASTVFTWLQDLTAVAVLIDWCTICMTYLRFYYAMKKQNISRERLPWAAWGQPYVAWISLVSFIVLLLTGGYTTFIHGHWDTETFVSHYINIPIILVLYFGYKLARGTRVIPLEEVPVLKYILIAERNPEPALPPLVGWQKLNVLWS
ncbi:Dicarboxylic amino acid permease [Pseudocercospora fuligena]|uniref:Dicarboxylic amino acid permease n=1 Tax=Pseudocercospora fuligena TaxID=685502 RepID=A0A8H6RKC2_9PEZI|nr:Dicarboxylic amino acid permease [Pseudocercospora fuligena]